MRVLAYIHTFNDADVIEQTIGAILRQTRTVDEILVVDNASSDGTLEQPVIEHATVMRHSENMGTSGAACTGFRYAFEHGYDWMWTMDPDSVPEPDALAKLVDQFRIQPIARAPGCHDRIVSPVKDDPGGVVR